MRKILLVLLMFSILPFSAAAGDNWLLHFSDGTLKLNGTDVCLDDGTCMSTIIAGGTGDISGVTTLGKYLTGGVDSGVAALLINETELNATITAIASAFGGSNSSFNQSLTDTLYAPINYGDDWNKTYADTLYATIGAGSDNSSWNETYADTLYADISVVDTNMLTDADFNATQMEDSGGTLSILETWLTTFWNTMLGTKDTDDLTEGSTNLYDNRSWNETKADGKYALIGAGADNSSWNQTYADTLYAPVNYGDDWNKTYADTLYSNYSDSDIDGTEAAFDGWDKNESNDFDGSWDSLTDIPACFADGIDNQSTGGVDWTELTSIPAGFDDDIDNDTTYTAGTNLTLDGTEFQLNVAGVLAWLETIFYDEESDLTTLLDDNYAPVNYGDDWNKTYADTLYADISVVGDNESWNKTYADTLYADISVTSGNESWNQSLADSLYINADGDIMTGPLNGTNTMNWTGTEWHYGNVFVEDSNDEMHHLNVDLTNLDELYANVFLTPLDIETFSNATGDYVNISAQGGETSITVSLSQGTTAQNYRLEYTNIILPLTAGTESTPVLNRVYVKLDSGTPTWVVSLTEPTVTHAMAARILLGATTTDPYISALQEDGQNGFLKRVQRRFRKEGLLYESGLDFVADANDLQINNGSYISGIYDLDITGPINISDGFYLIRTDGSYNWYDSFDDILQYSDGNVISSNRYYNVVFGVTPYDGSGNIYAVVQTLPATGGYTSVAEAYADPDGALKVYPSNDFAKLNFLPVARMVLQQGDVAQEILTDIYAIDYRGGLAGGIGTGGGLTETDPVWTADKADYSTTSEADLLYAPINYGDDWNKTYADTLYADISVVDTNVLTDGDFNATQMEDNGGTLNILETWLSTLFDTFFGTKDSDDLTEGSTNLYDNSSWNQTYATTIYAPANYGDDWNKTYGDTLYEPISSHFDASTTVNITCFNDACDWYNNATDSCEYLSNGGKECAV